MPQTFFGAGIFWIVLPVYVQAGLDYDPISTFPFHWDDRYMPLCPAFLLVEMKFLEFFIQAGFELRQSFWSLPPE
jgi:hypothetical protein